MASSSHRRSGTTRAALALTLVASGAAAGLALSTGTVPALPSGDTCIVRTYYEDADLTRFMGSSSDCPGHLGLKGRQTQYYKDDTIDMTPPKPIGAGGDPGIRAGDRPDRGESAQGSDAVPARQPGPSALPAAIG